MASADSGRRSSNRQRQRRHPIRNNNDDAVIVLESSDCIDLTRENNNDDVIDITQNAGLMDLPVVVLTPTDFQGPVRHRRGSGRRGRRRSGMIHDWRARRLQEARSSETQNSAYVTLSDDSDTDLPDPSEEGLAANSSIFQSPENVKIVCPVCMDDTRQIRRNNKELKSTTCGHIFCNVCIETAIRLQHQCPTCRKKLTMRSFHPLFI